MVCPLVTSCLDETIPDSTEEFDTTFGFIAFDDSDEEELEDTTYGSVIFNKSDKECLYNEIKQHKADHD